MCIVYFSTHVGCTHSHILGAWNCGLNCPTDARHTFFLDNAGFDCTTCVFLRGEELDPDVSPVEYYAPLFGGEESTLPLGGDEGQGGQGRDEGVKEDGEGGEEELGGHGGGADYKSLSDPESETSEWREETPRAFNHSPAYEHATPMPYHPAYDINFSPSLQPAAYNDAYDPSLTPATPHNAFSPPPQMTPGTAAHRDLVRDQLANLPAVPQVQAEGQGQVQGPVPMAMGQYVVQPGQQGYVPGWVVTRAGWWLTQ